ncbi:hypothetical protein LCGC14_1807690 [marine sediment metagenome]|uniref:Uncharacterized protein n=1 Tax=marine sediment metagenome TaxID=412755 RepID=A0A0F9HAQ1_9ZZZZ
MAEWARVLKLRRNFWKGQGLGKLDARHRYYYNHSLRRYLKNPKNKQLHEDMNKALREGEMGIFDGVTLHCSK